MGEPRRKTSWGKKGTTAVNSKNRDDKNSRRPVKTDRLPTQGSINRPKAECERVKNGFLNGKGIKSKEHSRKWQATFDLANVETRETGRLAENGSKRKVLVKKR